MSFTYSPLRKDQIRLLSAVRERTEASVTATPKLRFRLTNVDCDAAPEYTAVSYTWGDEPFSKVIWIDGQRFMVKPNLWSCLYYISTLVLAESSRLSFRYMWADAICINQSDEAEKTAQVAMMGQIYRQASVVSVWLGLMPLPDHFRHDGEIMRLDIDDFDWTDHIEDLANRPYWSRRWVIQELLVAQEIYLWCSGSCMSLENFKARFGGAIEQDMLFDHRIDGLLASSSSRKYRALPLVVNRHVDRYPELTRHLHDLLITYRHAECRDPRDRVFALLSLVPHDERAILDRLFPNYSLSHDGVVAATMAYLTDCWVGDVPVDIEASMEALGVSGGARQRRLMRAAKHVDWWGDHSDRGVSAIQHAMIMADVEGVLSRNVDEHDIQVRRSRTAHGHSTDGHPYDDSYSEWFSALQHDLDMAMGDDESLRNVTDRDRQPRVSNATQRYGTCDDLDSILHRPANRSGRSFWGRISNGILIIGLILIAIWTVHLLYRRGAKL